MRESFINLFLLAMALFCFYQIYSIGHEAIALPGKAMTRALGVAK